MDGWINRKIDGGRKEGFILRKKKARREHRQAGLR